MKKLIGLLIILISFPVGMAIAALAKNEFSVADDSRFLLFLTYTIMFGFIFSVSFLIKGIFDLSLPSIKPQFLKFQPFDILISIIVILSWNVFVTPLAEYLPEFDSSRQLDEISRTGFISVLTAIVIAPICEEWIFRGILLSNLRTSIGGKWAVIISALIFGLSHFYPLQALTAFGAGLVLGLLYIRTGSLMSSAIVHIFYNGIIYVLYVFFPAVESIVGEIFNSKKSETIAWICSAVILIAYVAAVALTKTKKVVSLED